MIDRDALIAAGLIVPDGVVARAPFEHGSVVRLDDAGRARAAKREREWREKGRPEDDFEPRHRPRRGE